MQQVQTNTPTDDKYVNYGFSALVNPTRSTSACYCLNGTDNGIGFDETYVDRIFND